MTQWAVIEEDGSSTLAPMGVAPRWDLLAEAALPCGVAPSPRQRRRIAHQVRQDVWRALARLRGFVPVVRVTHDQGRVAIRAGGCLMTGRPTARDTARIDDILNDKNNQRRWMAFAARGCA